MENQISANTVILWTVLAMLVVATFVGNSFVITAILVDKNLQTNANQLVLSLAVADLMVACLVMPLGAYNEVYQGWYLGTQVCEFWTSADVLCCTASILNLLAIALDRYWAVTSVDYIYRRTRRRIIVMVICVWTFGAVVSLAPIFGWKDPKFSERVLVEHKCLVSQDVGYQIFATISTFYAPLVLLLALYWRIFQVARKRIHRKPGDRLRVAPVQGPPTTTKLASTTTTTLASNTRKRGSAAPASQVKQHPRGPDPTEPLVAKPPPPPPCQLMNKALIEGPTRHVTSNGSSRRRRPSSPLPGSLSPAPANAQTTGQQLSPHALLLWSRAASEAASMDDGCKMNNHQSPQRKRGPRCCVGGNSIGLRQSCCTINTCAKLCEECCCSSSNCGPPLALGFTSSNPNSLEGQLNHSSSNNNNNNNSLLEPVSASGRLYARSNNVKRSATNQLLDKDLPCQAPLQVSGPCGGLDTTGSRCGSTISMSAAGSGPSSISVDTPAEEARCGTSFCSIQPSYEANNELDPGDQDEEESLSSSFPPPHTSITNGSMKGQVESAKQQQQQQEPVWRHKLGPKRSLDIRRRFKVLGELISFLQTSKNYSFSTSPSSASASSSSASGHQSPPSSFNQWKEPDLVAAAAPAGHHQSTGVATVAGRAACLAAGNQLQVSPRHELDQRPDGGRKCSGVLQSSDRLQPAANKQPQVVRHDEQSQEPADDALRQATPLHQLMATSASSPPLAVVVNDHASVSQLAAAGRFAPTSGRPPKSLSSRQQAYTNKANTATSQQRANIDVKREKKAAKTLAIITGVFVCCWLPFFLNAIIMPICGARCTPSDLVLSILLWLGYLNSMLNPIIYTIFSPDFRRAFRRLLCWPALGAGGGASSRS